ncbi:hypothetical protein [Amycolatopsis thermoflava]|nr:hypothetical protein [Amycolatopsis thermoflava]
MTMPTMVAAISVLDSKSPRRLERPPVASTAGMRVFGTGSFGSAGTVGATLRGSDEGGAGRTTAPGSMTGEQTPAALATTPVAPAPPAAPLPPAGEDVAEVKAAQTIVFEACVGDAEPGPAEPLIVPVDEDADAQPAKERRNRPLILATASAGLTLAGAMLVGGWIAGPGGTAEPVSLAGGHAAPQEPTVAGQDEADDAVPPTGQFTGILPIAATKQAAPQTSTPKATAPATKKTTQQAAPKQTRQQAPQPRYSVPQYSVPRYEIPDWRDYERHYDYDYGHDRDRDYDREGRRHR